MSAENEDPKDAPRPRFTAADARERVEQARHKAEFILSRAYGLLRDPKQEWQQIKAEETTIPNIMLGYVAPLAAVPPICGLIGAFVFGVNYGGVDLRPALDDALIGALVSFVASVAMVFALGILINATAENFAGDRNDLAAQKVAAYAMTPTFMSGVFSLWPPLWWLSLIAIAASVFLLYRGLPALMKTPEDQALGYTATVAIAGMIAFILLFSLSSCVTGAGGL